MTIIDKSFSGDQKNNGNNSADKKHAQPFVNPFARHIQQQAQNSGQISNQKTQTPNLNRPNPHQIDSSTEISNPFAQHIKLTKVTFAQVVQKAKSPARSISTPSPLTLDSTLSAASKLEHWNSAPPVLETKASSVVDSDDIPGSDSSSTDNNGADTNSSIPKIPLYFGKHKSKLLVPISTDLKITGNGKPPSNSDAVMELQRVVKRAMVAGRLRRRCENCGSTHHCCGRTILEEVSSIPPTS